MFLSYMPIGTVIDGEANIGLVISLFVLLSFGALFLRLSTLSFARVDFSRMNRNRNDGFEL